MSNLVVAAVDVSGSTRGLRDYFPKVETILDDVDSPLKVILWSDEAKLFPEYETQDMAAQIVGSGGTAPETFVQLLKDIEESFHLYIFTDGMIEDSSVSQCKIFLDKYGIFDKLMEVKLYYIGYEEQMNLKMTDVFTGMSQEIFINDIFKHVGMMYPNLDLDNVDYEFVMKDDSLKASVISLLNSGKTDKASLKQDLQKLTNRILKTISQKEVIEPFYIEDNVTGCVDFIKKNYNFPNSKVEFQRKMSEILCLFDKNVDTYSLSVFKSLQPIELKYEEPEEECQDVTCDILYENCKTVSFPVKMVTEEKRELTSEEKKIIRNPFRLLQSSEKLSKLINLVEPYIIDYETYKKIQNNRLSPFTRDPLQGVYVLHNDTLDVYQLVQNNSFVLSVMFGNKLPGNKVLWNIVFLYAMAKSERFSKYKELLFQEIKYLGENFKYFVTLTPFMNPPFYEKLNVCFWYIAKVSHIAFPNNKKNMLRSMDEAPNFLQFYSDVYGKVDLPNEMNAWQLWKYFISHRSDPSFIFYILAHHFNHKCYENGAIVLFQDKCTKELENALDYVKNIDVPTILSLFKKLMSSHTVTPCDDLSEELLNTSKERITDPLSDDIPEKTCSFEEPCVDHVSINIKTGHPFVICRVTGKHWKECAGNYDRNKESYLRIFRRYCIAKQSYPANVDDLLIYLNDFIFRNSETPQVFHKSVETSLSKVLSLFRVIMKTYPCEVYLRIANKYFKEDYRLSME